MPADEVAAHEVYLEALTPEELTALRAGTLDLAGRARGERVHEVYAADDRAGTVEFWNNGILTRRHGHVTIVTPAQVEDAAIAGGIRKGFEK